MATTTWQNDNPDSNWFTGMFGNQPNTLTQYSESNGNKEAMGGAMSAVNSMSALGGPITKGLVGLGLASVNWIQKNAENKRLEDQREESIEATRSMARDYNASHQSALFSSRNRQNQFMNGLLTTTGGKEGANKVSMFSKGFTTASQNNDKLKTEGVKTMNDFKAKEVAIKQAYDNKIAANQPNFFADVANIAISGMNNYDANILKQGNDIYRNNLMETLGNRWGQNG